MGFSNDPFTPAQTRIDAVDVVAREQANGDVLISARRNRLIVEEQLPIPVTRRQLIQKEEEVENRWVFGIDNKDRDGFFIGRELKTIELSDDFILRLEPQFLVQRAVDGETSSVSELFGLGPLPQDVGPPLQPLLTSHPLAVGADAPPLWVASPLFALLLRRVCMSGPLVGRRWRFRRRFRRQPLALALALASSRCGGARAFVGSIEHSTSPARRSLRVRWIFTPGRGGRLYS